jgi:polyphenol oxidase
MEYEKKKAEWVEYSLFSPFPFIFSATFLRHGGVSEGAFVSLNVGAAVGDHPDAVKVNRDMIRKLAGVDNIVFAKQEHGTFIYEVEGNEAKMPVADVLFTRKPGIAIGISHADCQAAIFVDPKSKFIAVAHAGWKGLVANVYNETVQYFCDNGSNKSDIIVGISPSLCPSHSEFVDYKTIFPEKYWSYQVKPNYFDLKQIAKDQMIECGIAEKNIEVQEDCSFCNAKDYYSFRRDNVTGRNATIVAMKS